MRKAKQGSQRRGATAVEFAIVAQVLFACVFAAFEFSRLHVMRNMAQDAAYLTARNSMVPGASDAEAIAHAEDLLALVGTQGAQIIINDDNPIDEDSSEVHVQIRIPMSQNAVLITGFIPQDKMIIANASMRTERYDGYFDPDGF